MTDLFSFRSRGDRIRMMRDPEGGTVLYIFSHEKIEGGEARKRYVRFGLGEDGEITLTMQDREDPDAWNGMNATDDVVGALRRALDFIEPSAKPNASEAALAERQHCAQVLRECAASLRTDGAYPNMDYAAELFDGQADAICELRPIVGPGALQEPLEVEGLMDAMEAAAGGNPAPEDAVHTWARRVAMLAFSDRRDHHLHQRIVDAIMKRWPEIALASPGRETIMAIGHEIAKQYQGGTACWHSKSHIDHAVGLIVQRHIGKTR